MTPEGNIPCRGPVPQYCRVRCRTRRQTPSARSADTRLTKTETSRVGFGLISGSAELRQEVNPAGYPARC